jgi:hypothetical protein
VTNGFLLLELFFISTSLSLPTLLLSVTRLCAALASKEDVFLSGEMELFERWFAGFSIWYEFSLVILTWRVYLFSGGMGFLLTEFEC